MFCPGLGGDTHLGPVLGEYARGYRILAGFSATGHPEDLAPTLSLRDRSLLATCLGLFALMMGRLAEAQAIRQLDDGWKKTLAEHSETSSGLQGSSQSAFLIGQLVKARSLAADALRASEEAMDKAGQIASLAA